MRDGLRAIRLALGQPLQQPDRTVVSAIAQETRAAAMATGWLSLRWQFERCYLGGLRRASSLRPACLSAIRRRRTKNSGKRALGGVFPFVDGPLPHSLPAFIEPLRDRAGPAYFGDIDARTFLASASRSAAESASGSRRGLQRSGMRWPTERLAAEPPQPRRPLTGKAATVGEPRRLPA